MGNVIMKAQQIAYGASNVEKALDDLKAPELIELNKRMDAIDAWKADVHEVTYTGSELAIENALALPARSLITEIEPIQDLHGQSAPYVGGAGKNKQPSQTVTIYGQDDKYFKLSEDATLPAGTWTASYYNDSTSLAKIIVNKIVSGAETTLGSANVTSKSRGSFSFTLEETSVIRIGGRFEPAETITDSSVFKEFQLESGSAATSFAPYSNICPISGRTAAVITRSDGDEISADFTIQLGQTVYDGDADWNMGDGSSRTGKYTLNGTEGVNWSLINTDPTRQVIYANIQGVLTNPKTTGRKQAGGKFSAFYYAENYAVGVAFIDANNGVWLNMTFEPNKFTDSNDFKTWLATNNIEFTYELATPIELTLTPTEVQMLKGYNRVTIDNGSIELKALVLGGDN